MLTTLLVGLSCVLSTGVLIVELQRTRHDAPIPTEQLAHLQAHTDTLARLIQDEQRISRVELAESLHRFHSQLAQQITILDSGYRERIEDFSTRLDTFGTTTRHDGQILRDQLLEDAHRARQDSATQAHHMQDMVEKSLASLQTSLEGFATHLDTFSQTTTRNQQALRDQLLEDSHRHRQEDAHQATQLHDMVEKSLASLQTNLQDFATHLDNFGKTTTANGQALRDQLLDDAHKTREEHRQHFSDIRTTLEKQLTGLHTDTAAQLEKMRATVDEKLQTTLETRLAQSFTQISERLEAVQRGLGEMHTLAIGVGDLKRVLSNVKTRGIYGEVQLAALLEEILTAEQYYTNIATIPGSADRVEFAIRLPGRDSYQEVLLPIDAKFPLEDLQRLYDAQERADTQEADLARVALTKRIEHEAKTIHDKYVCPPHTTDFAILFLATESLYAEVLRQPGFFEKIQQLYRVTLVGPATVTALLNSLRMGFRTLAIEQRSSEVWHLLGAVKTEFGKFATVLEKTSKQLATARNTLDSAGVRTRAIERKLRQVESLPSGEADSLLADSFDSAFSAAQGSTDSDPESSLQLGL